MVSRTSKYNNRVKQLEATAAQLQVSAEQVSLETAQQGEYQLILADGVCQQMALYDVLVPTQQQWLAVEPCTAQQQEPWGSDTKRVTISPGLSSVVELVEKCNPMLKAVFNATPEQVREAAALTRDGLIEIHRQLFMELLVLLELMSPQRYQPEPDVPAATDTDTAAAPAPAAGQEAAAAGEACNVLPSLPGSCSTDAAALEAAAVSAASIAAAAEERLHELMHESLLLGGLVVLHNMSLVLEVCSINLATHAPCVPPLGHFVRVAERLELVEGQVIQMRLMLRQYNRSMQQQLQQGLRLLEVSQDSTSLQVKVGAAQQSSSSKSGGGRGASLTGGGTRSAGATPAACASTGGGDSSTQQRRSSSSSSRPGVDSSSGGGAGGSAAAAAPPGGGDVSGGDLGSGSSQQQQQQQEAPEDGAGFDELGVEGLFRQMEQHLGDRIKVMQLMGFWVANTLTSRQMARFIVHSWPYYPQTPALAEAAGMLRPSTADTTPGVKGADAAAADTHTYLEWRRSGMRAELNWLLQHAPEFAGSGSGEGEGAKPLKPEP